MKKQLLILGILLLSVLVFAEGGLTKEPVITAKADYTITEYANGTDTTSITVKATGERLAFQSFEQWCSSARVEKCGKEAYLNYLDSEVEAVISAPAKEIPMDYSKEISDLKTQAGDLQAQVQVLTDWQKKFCETNPENKACG